MILKKKKGRRRPGGRQLQAGGPDRFARRAPAHLPPLPLRDIISHCFTFYGARILSWG